MSHLPCCPPAVRVCCGLEFSAAAAGRITAPPGSVFIQDTRLCVAGQCPAQLYGPAARLTHDRVLCSWHTAASNPSDQPRVAVVARFAPWWLTAEMGWGDGAQEWVPRPIYDQMSPALQKLVRHRTCGIEDELQTPVNDPLTNDVSRWVWALLNSVLAGRLEGPLGRVRPRRLRGRAVRGAAFAGRQRQCPCGDQAAAGAIQPHDYLSSVPRIPARPVRTGPVQP